MAHRIGWKVGLAALLPFLLSLPGCGPEEPKHQPVYLADFPSNGFPGYPIKVWFTGEVVSVEFAGKPASKIGFDEEKGWWYAEGRVPEDVARSRDGYVLILPIKWVDVNGWEYRRIIGLYCECCSEPEVIRTIPSDKGGLPADELNRWGVIVEFSEPIDVERSGEIFELRELGGEPLELEVEWTHDRMRATLRPKGWSFEPGRTYVLKIDGYYDAAGNQGRTVEVVFKAFPP